MIRNLRILLLVALAVAAVGALSVSAAWGSEFHCASAPCRATLSPDGTGTNSHHVFVVKNSAGESVAYTCKFLRGETTSSTTTAPSSTFENLAYVECNASGEPVTVSMNGCKYKFAAGPPETITIECPAGKMIEVEIATGCIVRVGPQGPLSGISYENIASRTQVTGRAKVPGIAVSYAPGSTKAICGLDPSKTPITAEYTTGNTVARAETDPGGVAIAGWWE